MAQYTDAELDQKFDPTAAPAWDRVNVDDQQNIVSAWKSLRTVAGYLKSISPDNDEQASKMIDELQKVALRDFDAVVSENLNEPPA
jgi:hypothetical protein